MEGYAHILMAVDLSEGSSDVATRARSLADAFQAKLSIVHVIEPISFTYGGDIPLDFSGIQEEIQKQAEQQLAKVAEPLGIPPDHQYLVLGRPETEIHTTAEHIGADLIVVGSHGRQGLALIFGSTANGVLHGAFCDVLAVRMDSDK